jgi:hypothetical protein
MPEEKIITTICSKQRGTLKNGSHFAAIQKLKLRLLSHPA